LGPYVDEPLGTFVDKVYGSLYKELEVKLAEASLIYSAF